MGPDGRQTTHPGIRGGTRCRGGTRPYYKSHHGRMESEDHLGPVLEIISSSVVRVCDGYHDLHHTIYAPPEEKMSRIVDFDHFTTFIRNTIDEAPLGMASQPPKEEEFHVALQSSQQETSSYDAFCIIKQFKEKMDEEWLGKLIQKTAYRKSSQLLDKSLDTYFVILAITTSFFHPLTDIEVEKALKNISEFKYELSRATRACLISDCASSIDRMCVPACEVVTAQRGVVSLTDVFSLSTVSKSISTFRENASASALICSCDDLLEPFDTADLAPMESVPHTQIPLSSRSCCNVFSSVHVSMAVMCAWHCVISNCTSLFGLPGLMRTAPAPSREASVRITPLGANPGQWDQGCSMILFQKLSSALAFFEGLKAHFLLCNCARSLSLSLRTNSSDKTLFFSWDKPISIFSVSTVYSRYSRRLDGPIVFSGAMTAPSLANISLVMRNSCAALSEWEDVGYEESTSVGYAEDTSVLFPGGRRLFKGVKSCTGLVSSELCFGTVKYLAVIVGWYSDSEMAPDSSIFEKWMSSSFDGLVTTSGVGALELGRNMVPALSHSTMVW
ncbi:hypothetical protein ADUPG1_012161 [Aduncisulcus paluster]|uniref:Uncharacterized protein n=1 Tax=Aduncisulcus paluster TaxID=2918883 RepID=A0ABQ5JYH6_9EUKA|nr:hypothetical protein ADUPG1_012161 [Aduncisulcus paluster]